MAATVSPEAVMAIALLKANLDHVHVEIEDVSKHFVELKERGLGFGLIALRKVPGGVYSEDVEAFVGRLLAAGYAKQRSPIDLLEDGIRICKTIVEDEQEKNPQTLRTVASALDFDLSRLDHLTG